MAKLNKLSSNAKDLYNCLMKGVVVGGNETPAIKELLEHKMIVQVKKGENKGKYIFDRNSLN